MDRTLGEEIGLYLADCRRRNLRPVGMTLVAYRQALEDFIRTLPDPDPPLSALTLAAGRAWQDARKGTVDEMLPLAVRSYRGTCRGVASRSP